MRPAAPCRWVPLTFTLALTWRSGDQIITKRAGVLMLRCFKILISLTVLVSAPEAAVAQERDYHFVSPRLLAAEVASNVADLMASDFATFMGRHLLTGRDLPGARVPDHRYSDEELKLLLAEFDRVAQVAAARIRERLDLRRSEVLVAIEAEAPWGLIHPRAVEWVEMNRDFTIDTEGLASLGGVLWVLAPEKMDYQFRKWKPDEDRKVFGMYALRRYHIRTMLNSPEVAPLLPARFDVARLRAREKEITSAGLPLAQNFMLLFPENGMVRATVSAQMLAAPQLGDLVEELRKLAGKAQCMAQKSGRC